MRSFLLDLGPCTILIAAALVACGDDTSAGGAGDTTSTSTTGGTKTSTTATSTSSASTGDGSSSASGSGASTTTASTSASASSSSTGAGVCMNVPIADTSTADCDAAPPALPLTGDVACTPADFATWPVVVYAVDVGEQDCLFMRATNVAGATDVADLFGAVIDPDGDNLIFDDDTDCTDAGDGLCPIGGLVTPSAGTAYIMVGAFESDGCPAGGTTDFRLAVSRNGVDVDLSGAAVCLADLNDLIP